MFWKFKETIIHLDGCDKTGKDKIRSELVKVSKGRYLVIVRTFLSQIVYSRLYKRDIDEQFFIDKLKLAIENGEYFFVLDANRKEIEKRFIENNEIDLPISQINIHRYAFRKLLDELREQGIDIPIINTNKKLDDEINEIIEWVNK